MADSIKNGASATEENPKISAETELTDGRHRRLRQNLYTSFKSPLYCDILKDLV